MYAPISEEALMRLTNPKQAKASVLTCHQCKKQFVSQARLSDADLSLCNVCNVDYMDGVQQARQSEDASKSSNRENKTRFQYHFFFWCILFR